MLKCKLLKCLINDNLKKKLLKRINVADIGFLPQIKKFTSNIISTRSRHTKIHNLIDFMKDALIYRE